MDKRVERLVSPVQERGSTITVIFQCKGHRVSYSFTLSEEFFDMTNSEHSTFENLLVNGLAFENKIREIEFYVIEVKRHKPTKALF